MAKDKEKELEAREKALAEKESELASREEKLTTKAEELEAREKALAEKEGALHVKDGAKVSVSKGPKAAVVDVNGNIVREYLSDQVGKDYKKLAEAYAEKLNKKYATDTYTVKA